MKESGRKGNQMAKEQRLGLMGKSMKGNGKMGNDVTGRNTTNTEK